MSAGSPSPIAIVDITPADEAATLAFCRQIFADEGWPLAFMDPAIAAEFDQPRDAFLLAKQDGAILGSAALKELSEDEALLTRMFVASSRRGTGLAQTLFDALLARARVLGYSWVVLDVNRESSRAIRFYEKQGMERFTPEPHPRWLESAPDERQYAHYFRKRVQKRAGAAWPSRRRWEEWGSRRRRSGRQARELCQLCQECQLCGAR